MVDRQDTFREKFTIIPDYSSLRFHNGSRLLENRYRQSRNPTSHLSYIYIYPAIRK